MGLADGVRRLSEVPTTLATMASTKQQRAHQRYLQARDMTRLHSPWSYEVPRSHNIQTRLMKGHEDKVVICAADCKPVE